MIDLTQIHVPDDSNVLDLWVESFGLACITAADELGIFDCLNNSSLSIEEMSDQLKLGHRALDAICKVLVSYNFLHLQELKLSLTELANTYWVSSSPLYRGTEFYKRRQTNEHSRVVQTAKEGWSPISDNNVSFTEMWEAGKLTLEAAQRFTQIMNTVILAPSISVAKSGVFNNCRHVIDVGGGSGAFCSALTANNSGITATLMDLPQVCEEAKQYISTYGQQKNIHYFPANFFQDEWPINGDSFYFSNILHDWSVDKCLFLLRKAYESLPVGGQIFIHECLLEPCKTAPRMTVIFNLLMHMNHRSQQFTLEELKSLLQEAGFKNPERRHQFSYYSLVSASK